MGQKGRENGLTDEISLLVLEKTQKAGYKAEA
jgi:hypothetical protein